ncbi:NAD-dependent epimerase/dehydratase family protein [Marinomonas mediterranea]|jgi:NAD dependent epimerase/dehydratase family.|uniref:NAD-dependent epimerase/dehydratase n=1 Tax=Marinomonas mediterranea (strain ATCC 700492 / JCM 21426 / NBRC 103028 / MMB-1) TaxID=717774 RepID=F2K0Y1_MARM1|nr:NAD-dependent epimerase/dehydratase family protein [Marinomonas mediterranea]ADZ93330.1 NAD-dependent epimerase/dehydratase [Marinomonas mediterranea MMB-1]
MVITRVLVAGCGDIGASIATNWAEKGAHVSAVRRTGTDFPEGVSGITADLTNISPSQLPDVDLIYLIMTPQGRTEQAYRSAYVDTAKALESRYAKEDQKSTPKLIFVSSTSVYGENQGEWIDESSIAKPQKDTAKCLLQAEQILSDAFGACSARCSGIYGPGRYRLIEKVKSATEWGINSWTNRIHRDDVVSGLMLLGERLLDGAAQENKTSPLPHIILTDDTPVSMWEVKLWIASRIGATVNAGDGCDFIPQSGKRIQANYLKECGWMLTYPSYVLGYEQLLLEKGEVVR